MNERIRELANQVTSYCDTLDVADQTIYQDIWKREFAELIVRECADIAKHHVMNISTYADAEFVEEQVKQHFGVEE